MRVWFFAGRRRCCHAAATQQAAHPGRATRAHGQASGQHHTCPAGCTAFHSFQHSYGVARVRVGFGFDCLRPWSPLGTLWAHLDALLGCGGDVDGARNAVGLHTRRAAHAHRRASHDVTTAAQGRQGLGAVRQQRSAVQCSSNELCCIAVQQQAWDMTGKWRRPAAAARLSSIQDNNRTVAGSRSNGGTHKASSKVPSPVHQLAHAVLVVGAPAAARWWW